VDDPRRAGVIHQADEGLPNRVIAIEQIGGVILQHERHVVGRRERVRICLQQRVGTLPYTDTADEQEHAPRARGQRIDLAAGSIHSWIDAMRDDANALGADAGGAGLVRDPSAVRPELAELTVDLVHPGGR
jgi:hypothetical protein